VTGHELARLLLALPDLPVLGSNSEMEYMVEEARVQSDDLVFTHNPYAGLGPYIFLDGDIEW